MTAPKPGDRVRVTFEAVVEKVYDDLVRVCTQATTCGAFGGSVPVEAVEVLAPPVYVNHDTTEPHDEDVVRTGSGVVMFRSAGAWYRVPDTVRFVTDELSQPLTLLVHDGQVIA